jgi:hypothetical protein
MTDSPARNAKGQLLPGHTANPDGRPKGARGMARYIMQMTGDGQDLVDWALNLWKDVDAPIEWRWRAFEWLTNRGAGGIPTTAILNVTNNVNSGRDLRSLSTEDLERIDHVFREAHARPAIDVGSNP